MALAALGGMLAGNVTGNAAAEAVSMASRKADLEIAGATIEKINEDVKTKVRTMDREAIQARITSNGKNAGLVNY